MEVEYYYCHHCGYEDWDISIPYSRTCASGDYCYCPLCGEENWCIDKEKEDE